MIFKSSKNNPEGQHCFLDTKLKKASLYTLFFDKSPFLTAVRLPLDKLGAITEGPASLIQC